jgi:hypothetical protein
MQRQFAAPTGKLVEILIGKLVEQPSKATYLAARDAVLSQAVLPLMATEMAELEELRKSAALEALRDRIDALPLSKVLSPRVHFLAAEAALALGDEDDVELERALFAIMLQGLLATGDGTPANPYIVCHATDEYDVLTALGLEAAGQSLVEREQRLFDAVACRDGREIWFDVTDVLIVPRRQAPARRQRRSALRPKSRISRLRR